MAKRNGQATNRRPRRTYSDDFKSEAVQMLPDGHSVSSVSKNPGINSANLLYRWKSEILARGGPAAKVLDDQVAELREALQRTHHERDILP